MSEFKVGDKVKFLSEELHEETPEYYPLVGTVGEVVDHEKDGCWIEWPEGTTSYDDCWWSENVYLELVSEE